MTEPQTRKRPWLPFVVVGAAVVVVGVLLSVVSSPQPRTPAARETFTLTGTLTVPARVETFVPDGGCIGELGYTDIRPGAVVTVYDLAGKTLAAGSVGAGKKDGLHCAYTLTVPAVPRGEGSYQVEVGNRGKVPFDEDVLVSRGASLTLN